MEFLETTKGGRQISFGGYLYIKNRTLSDGSTYWECSQRRNNDGCKGRIAIDANDVFMRQYMENSHPPNPERVEVVKSRAGMKRAARNTAEKTHNILTENIAGLSDETLTQMTQPETLRRDIRRHKRPNQPPVPQYLVCLTTAVHLVKYR